MTSFETTAFCRAIMPFRAVPLLLLIACLTLSGRAEALDADRSIAQFQHTAWTLQDGAPPDIWALAQSPDGYLWLGTGAGLYRFDGVRFERVRPTAGDHFPSTNIRTLMALPSGAIWMGYHNGGASVLEKGTLTNYMNGIPRGAVAEFGIDKKNTIWAATDGGLARLINGRWQEESIVGATSNRFSRLLVSRDGTLWTSNETQVFFLRPGLNRFQLARTTPANAFELTRASDGSVWYVDIAMHTTTLLDSFANSEGRNPSTPDFRAMASQVRSSQPVVFDQEENLWQTYQYASNSSEGISRTPPVQAPGNTQNEESLPSWFGMKDGLTSDIAGTLLEDREGNIWVGTNLGLDRFRAGNIVPEVRVPTTSGNGYRVAQGKQSIFYVADSRTVFAIPLGRAPQIVARFTSMIMFLHAARDGTLWIATADGRLFRLTDKKLGEVALPAAMASAYLFSCAEDKNGALWVSVNSKGIFRFENGEWRRVVVRPDLAEIAPRIIEFDSQGRMWLHYRNEQLIVADGKDIRSFSLKSGLDVGEIESISTGPQDILVGGDLGLARLGHSGFQTLHSTQVPALQRIAGIAQTKTGDVWINGIAGILHTTKKDLDAAFAQPSKPLHYDLFDFRDGLPGLAQQDSYQHTVIEGSNGWLWFITNHGIARIDPAHLHRNLLPPPVSISSLNADGKEYALWPAPTLEEGISNLQIDYTALSLSVRDRVRFRYKLDGVDTGWTDPGSRRQAIYTKLGPGDYRFRVIAANNDGVWNNTGATLAFTIPPTFWQTRLFLLLCMLAGFAVLWALYTLRLRQVAAHVRDRLEERIFERERIARELHDTLLQGFQALVLRLQNAVDKVPVTEPAHKLIERELERADAVLIEGRDRVRNLRLTHGPHDLSQVFAVAAATLQLDQDTEFHVVVDGTPRRLHPVVFDESAQIGTEAIFNAIRHASAKNINAKISYDRARFSVQIRDDGKGIDPEVLSLGGRHGHFGLTGMRERAKKVQAELVFFSRPHAGTSVTLTIPARLAYSGSEGRRPWWAWRPPVGGD